MKSKYKKSVLALQAIFCFTMGICFALLFFYGRYHTESFRKTLVRGIGVMMGLFLFTFAEYFNRYIKLDENCAKFNSYRVIKGKKAMFLDVCYENIIAIDSKRLPAIGIYKVIIRAKNMPGSIPITPVMSHYWKLVAEICNRVQKHNPQVNISDDLLRELERRQKNR